LEGVWKSSFSAAKDLLMAKYDELKARCNDTGEIQRELREFIKDNRDTIGELDRYKWVDDDGIYTGSESVHNPHPGGYEYDVYHPQTREPMRRPANGYRFPESTLKRDFIDKGRIIYGPDEHRIIKIKVYLSSYMDSFRSVILLDGRLGSYRLRDLFGNETRVFRNPKPPQLIERAFAFAGDAQELIIGDYFAGSGVSGDAAIGLSRATGRPVGYFLVEFGDHFDSVILPRLKKIVYSSGWQSGKPTTRDTGISHCFKYLRLESYEDALGNIAFSHGDRLPGGVVQPGGDQGFFEFDKYVLEYMLDFETSGCGTLLRTDRLVAPFDYKLEIRDGDDLRLQRVDLPETFNFLIGLRVRTRRVYWREVAGDGKGAGRMKYLVLRGRTNPHATGGEREVVVIWRTTEGWGQEDYSADRVFIEEELGLTKDADEVFVNDDSFLRHPNAKTLDPVFKRRMFNEPE
jgi:adenine-specific DNA-methyltransferase